MDLENDDHPFITKVPENNSIDNDGVGWAFFKKMKKHENFDAQYITDTGEEDTYGHLLTRSIRTAIKLRSKKLTKNDVIGLCSRNHKDTCVPVIASFFLGIKYMSYEETLPVNDTVHLLNISKPSILFVYENAVELMETSCSKAGLDIPFVVFGSSTKYEEFSEYVLPQNGEDTFEPVKLDSIHDTAVIVCSSGTTGLPKGICLSHYALLSQQNERPRFVVLTYSTFYWFSAVSILVGACLAGDTRLICESFDLKKMWMYVEKYKIQFLFLTPYQSIEVANTGKPEGTDVSSVILFAMIGSKITANQVLQMKTIFPNALISQAYGQTEAGGLVLGFLGPHMADSMKKPGSCGKVLSNFTVKIVDPDTEAILGPNQPGEMRLKSKSIMNGYYNQDSSDCYDSKGWFKTGDILSYDEDRFFFFVDRIKETLKFRGWQISPAYLEEILHEHPAVGKAVVIGLPHEQDGDHPLGIVVLKDGFEKTTADEIEAFVASKVHDRQRLRGGVRVVSDLPINPNGKFHRRKIKELVYSGEM